jgi:hypothetical protein
MTKAQMLTLMAERTGLERNTIKDLMKKGWIYDDGLGIFTAPKRSNA